MMTLPLDYLQVRLPVVAVGMLLVAAMAVVGEMPTWARAAIALCGGLMAILPFAGALLLWQAQEGKK